MKDLDESDKQLQNQNIAAIGWDREMPGGITSFSRCQSLSFMQLAFVTTLLTHPVAGFAKSMLQTFVIDVTEF
jgi:hypothetical protein